jgi:hypothetical protein
MADIEKLTELKNLDIRGNNLQDNCMEYIKKVSSLQ